MVTWHDDITIRSRIINKISIQRFSYIKSDVMSTVLWANCVTVVENANDFKNHLEDMDVVFGYYRNSSEKYF